MDDFEPEKTEEEIEPTLPDAEPTPPDAGREVLEMAFDSWMSNWFSPIRYPLTRTFAHFSKAETYSTEFIFAQVRLFQLGDHATFLRKIAEFRRMIMEEWDHHPEGRTIFPAAPKK